MAATAAAAGGRLSANRDFTRLFAAQVTSLVGSGVTSVALAAFAYELTGRNATAVVGTALALHFAEAAAGAAAIVGTVAYVRDVLGRGETAFAVAMAAVGVGSSSAALALARRGVGDGGSGGAAGAREKLADHLRYHRAASRTLVAGGALLAVALLPGALVPAYGVLLLLWAMNGAGQALIAIPSVGLLAQHTAPGERGRAYAAHFALTHLFWLVTYPAVGFLGRAVGTPWTFTIAGMTAAAATGLALTLAAPHRAHELG